MEEYFIKSLDGKINQNSKFFYTINYTEKWKLKFYILIYSINDSFFN